jgi:hypothetical protein
LPVTNRRGRFATRLVLVGLTALLIGILIYFSSRSLGGGVAGVVLSGLLAWFVFERAVSIVRAIRQVHVRVAAHHTILGGCLGAITLCGIGGLVLFFGRQMFIGVVGGGLITFLNHRAGSLTLAQLAGLDPIPEAPGSGNSLIQLPEPLRSGWQGVAAAAVIALLCIGSGVVLTGLGAFRVLEGYAMVTDMWCTHPCGMVDGLWVEVIPDSHGDVVTRLDPATVRLRLRFRDDVAGDKVASRTDLTLTGPIVNYLPVTNRPGCDAWPDRTLHIDDTTSDLTMCFALLGSDSIRPDQLLLNFTQPGGTAPIKLGMPRSGFGIQIGVTTPSPSSQ